MPSSAGNWLIQGRALSTRQTHCQVPAEGGISPREDSAGAHTRKLVRAATGDSICRSGPPFFDRDAQKSPLKWGEKIRQSLCYAET
ncbi:hypothetical protein TRIATDRAFT_298127 [Trichoderma atroviride IMI 206040]|uniref:Uncharacterized protein n=1 Tax=Hypocrea atroviridis (strain ATCC 20476 / IMI 206040) TaxID=452589 RepID=G9NLM7_HYPAI|nr:uncharacterized protein TRIATDRAFT_298127 [Trichoderma atroviride IMI 206040]EHK48789.1 hypothetical protein TRIATDRAFT_298127 [Trichoderma atroviride IMI 206040]